MSYYTVRRDDSEIRVVVCPKCRKADITKTNEVIPYASDGYLMKLCQCNSCKSYFSFDREDGMKEITKEQTETALTKKWGCDMMPNGEDQHGHSYYILFKSRPPTISDERYDELLGFTETHTERDKMFDKFLEKVPSVYKMIRYRDIINNIDFESMTYLDEKNKFNFEIFNKVSETVVL